MKKKDKELLDEMLQKLTFFNRLSDRWKNDIRAKVHVIDYKKGETVLKFGRSAGGFYMVATGTMGMIGGEPASTGKGSELRVFGRGDYFGAFGLLTGGTRVFSVVAREDSSIFIMGKDDFVKMLKENPGMKELVEMEASECRKILEARGRKKEREREKERELEQEQKDEQERAHEKEKKRELERERKKELEREREKERERERAREIGREKEREMARMKEEAEEAIEEEKEEASKGKSILSKFKSLLKRKK